MKSEKTLRIEGAYAALQELKNEGILPAMQATKKNAKEIVEGFWPLDTLKTQK